MSSRSTARDNISRERGAILGSRLQRLASVHGLRINNAKLRELDMVISEIDDFFATLPMEEVAACFAEGSELRAGLVRVVSDGARLSPTGAQTKGSNQALLRHVGTVACSVAGQLIGHIALPPSRVSPVLPELLDFNRRLLRAQTLQACAREAATAVERLMPGARPRPRQEEWGAATAAFLRALWLLYGFSMHAGTLSCAKPGIQRRRALPYLAEFASALAGSCIMEHTARLLLLLLLVPPSPGEGNDALTQMARRFGRAFAGLAVALEFLERSPDGPTSTAALQLRSVLSGPCTNHTLLSLGIASLAAVDGGPSHGLQPALMHRAAATRLAAATAISAGGRKSDGSGGAQRDRAQQEAAAVRERAAAEDLSLELRHSVLSPLTVNAVLTLPPGRRAAKSLCLRVCRLAVAQAEAEAAQQAAHQAAAVPPHGGAAGAAASSGGRSRGAPPAPVLLPPQTVCALALQALTVARSRMPPQRLQSPGDGSGSGPTSAAWAAEAAEWWRQAVAVVRYAMGGLSAEEVSSLASLLVRLPQEGLPAFMECHGLASLPPRPPPALAAALEGGLLPCLERLLRRAGEDATSPETQIADSLPGLTLPSASLFVLLLAYGDPRQAAALVVTLAKQLRRLDLGQVGQKLSQVTGPFPMAATLADGVLHALVKGLVAAPGAGQLRSASSAAAPAPASRQLGDMASLAAALWLPQLSRLVLRTLELTEWRVGRQDRLLLCTLLDWVRVLAARHKAAVAAGGAACGGGVGGGNGGGGSLGRSAWQPSNAAAAEAAAAAGPCVREGEGGEEEDGGCTGWRALLVGMGAVRLVLAALRLEAEAPHGSPDFNMRLAAVGCDVAAACPEEARAACSDPRYFGSLGVFSAWDGILKASEQRAKAAAVATAAEATPADEAEGAAQGPARGAPVGAFRLAHPAAARRLLLQQRWCGHPGCTNLGGDGEAELPWEACPSCGEVGYCCVDCRTAHWWTGHMAECGRQQPAREE